jgi:hypothetical protein
MIGGCRGVQSWSNALQKLNDFRVLLGLRERLPFAIVARRVDTDAEELAQEIVRRHPLASFRRPSVGLTPEFEVSRLPADAGLLGIVPEV